MCHTLPPTRAALPGLASLLAILALPAPGLAAASPWVRGAQSEARLLGAGEAPGARGLLAGLEIRLQPRFITYWRDPGDAGVPPAFSFAGSTNLREASVRYPAPSRLDEAGAAAFGYEGGVTFPILIEPADPAKPVDLAVRLDYAACHDICLPAHADLRLVLDRGPSPEAAQVRAALAAVPRPAAVGEAGARPAILAVTPPDAAGTFSVRAALPEDGRGTLFVEAPEGWAYAADAAVPDGPGRVVFPVKRLDGPKGVERPMAPLVLTLTSAAGAVEAPATLTGTIAAPGEGAASKP